MFCARHFDGKWAISLVHVSKPLVTTVTAIQPPICIKYKKVERKVGHQMIDYSKRTLNCLRKNEKEAGPAYIFPFYLHFSPLKICKEVRLNKGRPRKTWKRGFGGRDALFVTANKRYIYWKRKGVVAAVSSYFCWRTSEHKSRKTTAWQSGIGALKAHA